MDVIKLYLRDMRHHCRFLTAEEERALAPRVKAGDPEAVHQLVLSVLPLVFAYIQRQPRLRGYDLEDMVQLANLAAICAIPTYNPERARFSTYVLWRVRAAVSHVRANQRALKRRWDLLSLDTALDDDGNKRQYEGPPCDPVAFLIHAETLDWARHKLAQLNPRAQEILERRAQGETLQKIGDTFGFSREWVRQLENRARAEFLDLAG